MSKTNIIFNNKNYKIDDASLSDATAKLKSHLSTTMNGSGATISLDGTSFSVDSTKLTNATNSFVSHLGTISGNGTKVVVNGVEYSVDASKVQGAISELETVFGNLNNSTPDEPTPNEERLEGDGAEYYTLAPTVLSFRSTAPLNELQEIQINGVTVDPTNYTLEEGSTIVTFPIDYLKTLNVGNYEVAVVSENKSAKGEFTVKAPNLNEHGFYYNQPYTAFVGLFGENESLFIKDDGTATIIGTPSGGTSNATYSVSGNNMTFVSEVVGTLTARISDDGKEIYCNELATSFVLGDSSILADEEYIYIYNETLNGYGISAIDKTKSVYGCARTGINGLSTVQIFKNGFRECSNLASIVLPNSITNIGYGAFWNCSNLTNITIPDGVTSIDVCAFYKCSSLASITIPSGVTKIDEQAFNRCSNLVNVIIPNSVTSIEATAFYHCESLASVNIPNSVTKIGTSAFGNCTNLTSVNIPNSVTNIGTYAFGNCTNLTSVNIPNSVKNIGDSAFVNCSSLTDVIIPDGIIAIYESTFSGCYQLKNITIPNGVETIGDYAFQQCKEITSIVLPDSVQSIGDSAFWGCDNLTSINYTGTKAEWSAITKESSWNVGVPATYVQCTDGTVTL